MNMKKCLGIACAVALGFMAGSVLALDNTGSGGTIMYTDSNGSNAVANPPYIGGYVIHTFTNSGTLNIPLAASADVLLVAGGGAGGAHSGGGGGAGGLIYTQSCAVAAGSTTVTVGTGGVAKAYNSSFTPSSGGSSSFGSVSVLGGGGGASRDFGPAGGTGGSGGGGSSDRGAGSGTGVQGNAGRGGYNNNPWCGGGGGGKGGLGGAASASVTGAGGAGAQYTVFAAVAGSPGGWFASGGSGGLLVASTVGSVGPGGGGGGSLTSVGTNGVANTGGGGGGGGNGQSGGNGGSGIVIVRYPYVAGSLDVLVTAPANGQQILPGASVTATVSVVSGTMPYAVTFYTNSAEAFSTNNASTNLFTIPLGTLADGTYSIYATVTDNVSSNATSATNTFTVAPDTTAPTPNPMEFAVIPAARDTTSIIMTATAATDALSPLVEYYFENVTNLVNSGWSSSPVWTNTGLAVGTTYGYRVKARDSATTPNETTFSAVFNAAPANRTLYWDGTTADIGIDGNSASAGGSGTWNTTIRNWDAGSAPHVSWATGDTAIFGGTAGTVTLGEAISVKNVRFTTAVSYTITGSSLNFASGGTITNALNAARTFTCGITGAPAVSIYDNAAATITFAPTSASQTLGTCTVPYEAGSSDKAYLTLDGTTTGNSVSMITYVSGNQYGGMYKQGSGTWTVGNVDIGAVTLTAGNLVVNGTIHTYYDNLKLNGGVFHYNNAGAVHNAQGIILSGGSLDNSSGAAITTSTYNPPMAWNANLTFIGSNGASSDLNLGTGAVTLGGNRIVTVSNALSTLTIGGAITDGSSVYGLTKAGDGTLWLKAANTYNGSTTVTAGTLSLGNGTSNTFLDDTAAIYIASGAVLDLDFTGTDTVLALFLDGVIQPAGTYDSTTPGGYITGSGSLIAGDGSLPVGIYYWDGPNVGGTGDGFAVGGSGTWSTSNANWDHGLIPRQVWNNTTADKAIFRTAAGTVTLGSNITLGEILIDGVDTYQIGSNTETYTLTFGGAKTITVNGQYATFKAGITGKPTISYTGKSNDNGSTLLLAPTASVNMDLGTINAYKSPITAKNLVIRLDGVSHSNSVDAITWNGGAYNGYLQKYGAGTWTVGNVTLSSGQTDVWVGKLIVSGTVNSTSTFKVKNNATLGGTGTITDPVTIEAGGRLAFDLSTVAASHDKLELTGAGNTLTFSGTSVLDITSSGGAKIGDYTLVTAAAGIVGVAPATVNLPAKWVATVSIENSNKDLVLHVTSVGAPTGTIILLF